jgi:hypothetical protein
MPKRSYNTVLSREEVEALIVEHFKRRGAKVDFMSPEYMGDFEGGHTFEGMSVWHYGKLLDDCHEEVR